MTGKQEDEVKLNMQAWNRDTFLFQHHTISLRSIIKLCKSQLLVYSTAILFLGCGKCRHSMCQTVRLSVDLLHKLVPT